MKYIILYVLYMRYLISGQKGAQNSVLCGVRFFRIYIKEIVQAFILNQIKIYSMLQPEHIPWGSFILHTFEFEIFFFLYSVGLIYVCIESGLCTDIMASKCLNYFMCLAWFLCEVKMQICHVS